MARPRDQRIFFPWERRGGLVRRLGLGRFRLLGGGAAVVALLLVIGVRERERAGIRQTRANLLGARSAVERYLADHEGGCPESLGDLQRLGYTRGMPSDAWGRPLRLVCPGAREGSPFELMSDGPDGRPGGLDRVE